jgi:hypothetical protein
MKTIKSKTKKNKATKKSGGLMQIDYLQGFACTSLCRSDYIIIPQQISFVRECLA